MRPEHENPPEIYYDDVEAHKYTVNSRIQAIQGEMTERALELLNLPENDSVPRLLLDIGCGSGLSGDVIQEHGHYWVGLDISRSMLEVAADRQVDGDLFMQDAGQGVGFRAGSFDGAVSISCIQWLCNADHKTHHPRQRLQRFFSTLYSALAHGARAVFQFYPESSSQIELITSSAMQSGFTGGLVIDYPNSAKRKKYFLCLFVGGAEGQHKQTLPSALTEEEDAAGGVYRRQQVKFGDADSRAAAAERRAQSKSKTKQRTSVKDRDWVVRKKETQRRKGDTVPADSKFTARKRKPRF